jgi:U4/U6 small nuclear ribonucleoprotein PRP31
MATIADDLLADLLEDDEEEYEDDEEQDGEDSNKEDGDSAKGSPTMDLDDDDDNADPTVAASDQSLKAVTEAEDVEEAQAQVEKINFAAIKDIASVARLLKTLKPVLEVSTSTAFLHCNIGLQKMNSRSDTGLLSRK